MAATGSMRARTTPSPGGDASMARCARGCRARDPRRCFVDDRGHLGAGLAHRRHLFDLHRHLALLGPRQERLGARPHQRRQRHRRARARLPPRHYQQIADQAIEPRDFVRGHDDRLARGIGQGRPRQGEIEPQLDRRQRIAYLVGHARRDATERRQALFDRQLARQLLGGLARRQQLGGHVANAVGDAGELGDVRLRHWRREIFDQRCQRLRQRPRVAAVGERAPQRRRRQEQRGRADEPGDQTPSVNPAALRQRIGDPRDVAVGRGHGADEQALFARQRQDVRHLAVRRHRRPRRVGDRRSPHRRQHRQLRRLVGVPQPTAAHTDIAGDGLRAE